jgi:hypothetical protein
VIYDGNVWQYARQHKDVGIYGFICVITDGEYAGRFGWYDDNAGDARVSPLVYLYKKDWTLDRRFCLCLRPSQLVDIGDVQKLADAAATFRDTFQFIMRDMHCERGKAE